MKSSSKLLSSKWLRIIFSVTISLGALYLALRGVDFSQVWQSIQGASWVFVLLALGSVTVNTLAKSLRWKRNAAP